MAGLHSNRTPQLGPWPAGVDNLAPEGELPRNEFGTRPVAFREADNVDLTKEGRVRRRQGYEARYTGTLVHSIWSDDALDFGLFVDNGVLHTIEEDASVLSLGVDVGDHPMSYELVGDRIYFSNAGACGQMLLPSRKVRPWGLATPTPLPVEVVPGYGLPAGTYQIAFTTSDMVGRESGAERAQQIEVPEGSGLLIGAPGTPLPPGYHLNVYLSAPNDNVLRLHSSVDNGGLISVPAEGIALGTHLLDVMPAGQLARVFNGVHWVADDRTLRWSPPFRYGLTDLAHNLIRFDARIDLLVPVAGGQGAGLYVAAGKRTYWLPGATPARLDLVDAQSAGAVPGTEIKVKGQLIGLDDDGDYTVWLSRRGNYVIGMPGGTITALKSDSAVIDDADRGASMFMERNGMRQVVTTLRGPRAQGLAVSDRAVAHVIHVDR